ncbi:MAG: ABC transporter permease, partial [Flavobacteriales bacterium]|nr:ABC transporter permease [Flavobacteriales bacterium]
MSVNTETIVYSAEKGKTIPQILRKSIKGFKEGHDLGKRLFIRDTRAQYRQSILGLLWVLLMPIAQTLVWVFLSKGGILNVDDTGVPYPLFVLTGITLWRGFVDSVNMPLNMFTSSKSILRKINFPKEALLITAFYKVLFNLAVSMLVLIPLFFYFGVSLSASLAIGIIAIVPIILFGMAIGILITPFGALFTDVSRLLTNGMQLYFFFTPIIYPMPSEGILATFNRFNPAAISIMTARDLLFDSAKVDLTQYSSFLLVTFLLLTIAL